MFCQMVNDFFDCANVRSTSEHETKRNERIKPYTSPEDERLIWMKDTFLKFLEDWKQSIQGREGQFTAAEREKMFLSNQTYEGFKISVNSHVEAIKEAPYSWFSLKHFLYRSEASRDSRVESSRPVKFLKTISNISLFFNFYRSKRRCLFFFFSHASMEFEYNLVKWFSRQFSVGFTYFHSL